MINEIKPHSTSVVSDTSSSITMTPTFDSDGKMTMSRDPRLSNNLTQLTIPLIPGILACSSSFTYPDYYHFSTSERQLCQDRKGWFDHLYPDRLLKSTVRIGCVQVSQTASYYILDQLKADTERDTKVMNGEMTHEQADLESEEWMEREWKNRLEKIPSKIGIALIKYHSVTLVMRLYEFIASKFVDYYTLDKLTLETSEYAKRTFGKDDSSSPVPSTNSTTTAGVFNNMFKTCWNANLISYLADYSIHQVILLYGYYLYVQHQRKKRLEKSASSAVSKKPVISQSKNNTSVAVERGSLVLSYMKKSTYLVINRSIGLTGSSIGGAIGTCIYPGFGTTIGLTIGDNLALSLADEILNCDAPSV